MAQSVGTWAAWRSSGPSLWSATTSRAAHLKRNQRRKKRALAAQALPSSSLAEDGAVASLEHVASSLPSSASLAESGLTPSVGGGDACPVNPRQHTGDPAEMACEIQYDLPRCVKPRAIRPPEKHSMLCTSLARGEVLVSAQLPHPTFPSTLVPAHARLTPSPAPAPSPPPVLPLRLLADAACQGGSRGDVREQNYLRGPPT